MALKRPVYLDAANIGYSLGNDSKFESRALLHAMQHFVRKGHKTSIVMPFFYGAEDSHMKNCSEESKSLLQKITESPILSQHIVKARFKKGEQGDDDYLLSCAYENGGLYVSRDKFKRQFSEHPEWSSMADQRRAIDFSFSGDRFVPLLYPCHSTDVFENDEHYSKMKHEQMTREDCEEILAIISDFLGQIPHCSAMPSSGDSSKLANENFGKGNFELAASCLSQSLETYRKMMAVAYCNRAVCHLKIRSYLQAKIDCEKSLEENEKYPKAMFVRAIAIYGMGKVEDAKATVSALLSKTKGEETENLANTLEMVLNNTASLTQVIKDLDIDDVKV